VHQRGDRVLHGQDPCPILVVQPTVEDAKGYSKEEIAPMLRDCEVLAGS
jgi:phage terminase large subunit GpA-like protein